MEKNNRAYWFALPAIVLVGVALVALPTLEGWRWVTLISPFFVAFLLLRVSGVPLLEKRADEKWGGQPDYEAYKKETPVLIPRIRSLRSS
jgi:steroid 5-alpha reductase family enzyme